jgi:hypothetical protein
MVEGLELVGRSFEGAVLLLQVFGPLILEAAVLPVVPAETE